MGLLPEPLADLVVAGLMRPDGGQEQLPVFGGKAAWGFPDEIGDLAVGGQPLQDGGIHVGAEREPVVGAGQVQVPVGSSVWLWCRTWAS